MQIWMIAALALLLTTSTTAAFAQDSDGDGAADSQDVYPCDPLASATAFAPAEQEHGVIAFEDQWPNQGDLDFNDVVVSYNYVFRTNAIGQVVGIRATYNAIAAGGSFHNGLGLSLPLPRGTAARATRTIDGGAPQVLSPAWDTQLSYVLASDLRELFAGTQGPINSRGDETRQSGGLMVVDIELAAPVSMPLGLAPFDLFIFRSGGPSHEIHRPEYGGTSGMNRSIFGTGDDGSREGRYFVDTQGMPFALVLPASGAYPIEGAAIHDLFPSIINFAASGGVTDRDFYQSNIVEAFAYRDVQGRGPLTPVMGPQPSIDRSCLIGVQHLDFLTVAEGGIAPQYQITDLAVDWDRDRAYFLDSDSDPALAILRSFRISTMTEDQQARMGDASPGTNANFPGSLFSDGDGFIYVMTGSSNSRPIIKIDASSYREVARFGINSSGLSNTASRLVAPIWMAATRAGTGSGYLVTGSIFDDIAVLDRTTMSYVWGYDQTVDEARVRGVVAGNGDEAWILGSNGGTSHSVVALYHLTISGGGVSITRKAFAPGDIDPSATAFYDYAGGLVYDATDGGLIFQVRMSNSGSPGVTRTVKVRANSIMWNVVTPFMINYEGPFVSQNRLERPLWTQMRARRLIQLDTRTGDVVRDSQFMFYEGGAQTYDSRANRLIVRTGEGWTRINLGP